MKDFPVFPPFEAPDVLKERLRLAHEAEQLDAAKRAARDLSASFKGLGEYCVRPDWSGRKRVSAHLDEDVALRLRSSFEAALRAAEWDVSVRLIDHTFGWNYVVERPRKPGLWAKLCRGARFFWSGQ